MVSDDEHLTVGVMLNHPASKGLEIEIRDKEGGEGVGGRRRVVTVPLRYGGEYAVKGQSPLIWLHRSAKLRAKGVGSSFGQEEEEGTGGSRRARRLQRRHQESGSAPRRRPPPP